MRSRVGTFDVNVPEAALTTVELDYPTLQQWFGVTLADEYVRVADPIVIYDWIPPYWDSWYGVVVQGNYHGRAAGGCNTYMEGITRCIMEHRGHQCHHRCRLQHDADPDPSANIGTDCSIDASTDSSGTYCSTADTDTGANTGADSSTVADPDTSGLAQSGGSVAPNIGADSSIDASTDTSTSADAGND